MKNIPNGAKIGILIQIIAFVWMIGCIVINAPVSDFVSYMFGVGLIIVLISCVLTIQNKGK